MPTLEDQIRQKLGDFWDERALPTGPSGATTVDTLGSPVESLTAVEVLLEIDSIAGTKLPNSVIQAGGYQTKDEFIEKLTAKTIEILEKAK